MASHGSKRCPSGRSAAAAPEHFRAGIDDIVILPLVVITLAVVKLLKAFFTLLIRLIDFLFPILLQLMRFPLFTLRILGDGIAAADKTLTRRYEAALSPNVEGTDQKNSVSLAGDEMKLVTTSAAGVRTGRMRQ